MKLYKIVLSGYLEKLSNVYAIADNPTEAQDKVSSILNAANYGASDRRQVVDIKLIAEDTIYGTVGVLFIDSVKGLEPKKKSS